MQESTKIPQARHLAREKESLEKGHVDAVKPHLERENLFKKCRDSPMPRELEINKGSRFQSSYG